MRKIIAFLAVLCTLCGSVFADSAIGNWHIYRYKSTDFVGLIDDIAPTGFEVQGDPEIWSTSKQNIPYIWHDGDSPNVAFQSDNVSPGLMINYETASFEINVTGFNDLAFYGMWEDEKPVEAKNNIQVTFLNSDNKGVAYKTYWDGEGLYKFGYEQLINKNLAFDFEVSHVIFCLGTETNFGSSALYSFADNTQGTVEFAFPASEVPEPSSLLALAFGGAGTVTLAVRRKIK